MKVLAIWRAAAAFPDRLEPLAQLEDIELSVLVPERWSKGLVRTVYASEIPPQSPLVKGGKEVSYRVIPARVICPFKEVLHFYPRLFSILSSERPDVLYLIEEHYSLLTYLALLWRETCSPRTAVVFKTWQNLDKRYPIPFAWMERFVLTHADGAIAANHEALEILYRKGLVSSAVCIPDGVDTEEFRPGIPNDIRRELSPDAPLIGYVGRFVPEKGLVDLLEALAMLELRAKLVLIGAGPFEDSLRQETVKIGISERVIFHPPVDRADMPLWMNALDVLVLPSLTCRHWKEQFGMVLPEAMASGVAVVGSNSGEIPHVIGEAGLIFPEGDSRELASRLASLLGNPDLRRDYGEKGRKRVLETYTREAVAFQTSQFLRQAHATRNLT